MVVCEFPNDWGSPLWFTLQIDKPLYSWTASCIIGM